MSNWNVFGTQQPLGQQQQQHPLALNFFAPGSHAPAHVGTSSLTGSSSSEQNNAFVGLGGIQNQPFAEGFQNGGSVVTAAVTGSSSVGQAPVYSSNMDLPVPKEIVDAFDSLK